MPESDKRVHDFLFTDITSSLFHKDYPVGPHSLNYSFPYLIHERLIPGTQQCETQFPAQHALSQAFKLMLSEDGIDSRTFSLLAPVAFEYPYAFGYTYILPSSESNVFPKCMPGSPFQAPNIGRFSFDVRSGDMLMITYGGKPKSIGFHAVTKLSETEKRHDLVTVPPIQYTWPYLPKTVLWKVSTCGRSIGPSMSMQNSSALTSNISKESRFLPFGEDALRTILSFLSNTIKGAFTTPEFDIDILLPETLDIQSRKTQIKFGEIKIGQVDNQISLRLRENFAAYYYMNSFSVTQDAPLLMSAANAENSGVTTLNSLAPTTNDEPFNNPLSNLNAGVNLENDRSKVTFPTLENNRSQQQQTFIDDSTSLSQIGHVINRDQDLSLLSPGLPGNSSSSFDLDFNLTTSSSTRNIMDNSDNSLSNKNLFSDTLPSTIPQDPMPVTSAFSASPSLNLALSPGIAIPEPIPPQMSFQNDASNPTTTFTASEIASKPVNNAQHQVAAPALAPSTIAPMEISNPTVPLATNNGVKVVQLAPRPDLVTGTTPTQPTIGAPDDGKQVVDEEKRRRDLIEARKRRNRLSAAKCNERKKLELEKLKKETHTQKERVRELHQKRLLAMRENEELKAAIAAKFSTV